MTITFSLAAAVGIALSGLLFIAVAVLCHQQGLFDGHDTHGIGAMFTLLLFGILWAVPSLAGWAIYATWRAKP